MREINVQVHHTGSLAYVRVRTEKSPQILQVYRDFLKPGSAAAYRNIEEEAARICAKLKCPHPYLGLESLTGPKEVWFLNGYASLAEQQQGRLGLQQELQTHRSAQSDGNAQT